jgi:hypothetical protein
VPDSVPQGGTAPLREPYVSHEIVTHPEVSNVEIVAKTPFVVDIEGEVTPATLITTVPSGLVP